PWYRRWVLEGGAGGPKVDDYEQESGEQVDVHPILKNISPEVYMRLAKAADHCPGLELKPGTHRRYPFGRAGAQLMGQLAAVIDVKSGEVRALVSYPDYDPNTLNEKYEELVIDVDNAPLMNRATQSQLEPGSTIKPAVGLGAITRGLITEKTGIECNGFLT